jgi:hypothetical protein
MRAGFSPWATLARLIAQTLSARATVRNFVMAAEAATQASQLFRAGTQFAADDCALLTHNC